VPNTLEDLRVHLFETIDALRNKGMPIDRAKAISEVAQTVINSAKVEVDFIKATGQDDAKLPVLGHQDGDKPGGINGVKVHRIR
jgi:hypothetical protein